MGSWNKFNEPSKLNKKGIIEEDLKHVKKICDTF